MNYFGELIQVVFKVHNFLFQGWGSTLFFDLFSSSRRFGSGLQILNKQLAKVVEPLQLFGHPLLQSFGLLHEIADHLKLLQLLGLFAFICLQFVMVTLKLFVSQAQLLALVLQLGDLSLLFDDFVP